MEPLVDRAAIDLLISRCAKRVKELEAEKEQLEDKIRDIEVDLEEWSDKVEELEQLVEKGQELEQKFSGLLGEEGGADGEGTTQKTNFERIVDFFIGQRNQQQTIAEIETGTGIPRSSISAVLYRTHTDRFRQVEERGGKQAGTWRLVGYEFDDDPYDQPPTSGEEIPF